jgi:hypothetical protein
MTGASMSRYESVAVSLALCCLPALAFSQSSGDAKPRGDTRAVIALDAQARAAVLSEMRMLLENVRVIIEAAAKNDLKAIGAAARASGLKAASEAGESMEKALPKGFVALGMTMHKEFDAIAAQAEKGGDAAPILASVAETMKKCSACHAAYQVQFKAQRAAKKQ